MKKRTKTELDFLPFVYCEDANMSALKTFRISKNEY